MAAQGGELAGEPADDFLAGLEQKLVGGMVGLGVAMGMQTGLFEVLVRLGGEPKTSQEIADAANFKERYVREWLSCMAASRVVNFDPDGERFWLAPDRANILDLKGLALSAPILCGGFLKVAECFQKDGPEGVAYTEYPNFDELMTITQGPFFRDRLVQEFIPSMPEVLKKLEEGIVVLDTGCGAGLSTRLMAQRFPKSHFYGLDLSEAAVAEAGREAGRMGLANVDFICSDAAQMPADWTAKFDLLFTIFVLHDLAQPERVLAEARRVLKPGSPMAVVEVNSYSRLADNLARFPDQDRVAVDFVYSLLNCLPTSLSTNGGGGSSSSSSSSSGGGGGGLGAFWGREAARKMIEEAGLEVLSVTELSVESMHIMCRKP